MPASPTISPSVRWSLYQAALDNATLAVEIMRDLPGDQEPTRELVQALTRMIETIRALDLPLFSAVDLLDAIAAGGQS